MSMQTKMAVYWGKMGISWGYQYSKSLLLHIISLDKYGQHSPKLKFSGIYTADQLTMGFWMVLGSSHCSIIRQFCVNGKHGG
jgi:hypothetical protein